MKNNSLAVVQMLLGAVMISFSGVYVKIAHVGPTVSGCYRMLFGGIILLAVALVTRTRIWRGPGLFFGSVFCGLAFAADLFVWHRSVLYCGPGLATILGNFQVFGLGLVGILFFRERPGLRFMVSVPLAVAGLFLIVGIGWDVLGVQYRHGVYLGLLTAFFYTIYILVLRDLQNQGSHKNNPVAILVVVSFSTCAFLCASAVIKGESFIIPDLTTLGALGAYGFFTQVLGWLLISRAMPRIPVSLAGLLLLLQPCLAFIWDIIFFARPSPIQDIIGACITLFAIYLGATSRQFRR
ncbi:MAG: DMT family transporter [Thermodesulfobacteriota bacterium]|nr:DMT family transporter [Thermodesulfobacteriota bacterium]